MKKTNSTIISHLLKAPLISGPFLLLLTLTSFALGQEDFIKQDVPQVSKVPAGPDVIASCTYTVAPISGSIVPGMTDIGNHGDDQVVTIQLPFPYMLYDRTFTSVNLSSNGNAQFITADSTFTNSCLPWGSHDYTIFPNWDDQYLLNSGFGIFTSISGSAPNRIFNIEWRAQYFPGSGNANYELRLYEGQTRFDVIYGTMSAGNFSATAGVQQNDSSFTQLYCNGSGGAATGAYSFIQPGRCDTPLGALSALPVPLRVVDTRAGSGFFDAGNHYSNDALRTYDIATLASLPAGTRAVAGRITVVNATTSGVIQESPNGPPGAGNDLGRGTAVVNYPASSLLPSFGSSFTSPLDSSGRIRLRGFMVGGGTVDVIIDINGYYQ